MKSLGQRKSDLIKKYVWFFSCIVIVFVLLFPIFWMVTLSIRQEIEVFAFPPKWLPSKVTFESYGAVLTDTQFLRAGINTLMVGISVVFGTLFLAVLAAFGLSRYQFRGKRTFIVYVLSTQMIPTVLLCIPYFILLTKCGLYDTHIGLFLAYLTFTLPFAVIMLRSFFDSIPLEVNEAAMVDGCTQLKALFLVILPLALPGIVATGVYAFIVSWNQYLLALILTSSADTRILMVTLSERIGQHGMEWTQVMAMDTLITFPLIIAFLALQKHFVRGLTAGSVKI